MTRTNVLVKSEEKIFSEIKKLHKVPRAGIGRVVWSWSVVVKGSEVMLERWAERNPLGFHHSTEGYRIWSYIKYTGNKRVF